MLLTYCNKRACKTSKYFYWTRLLSLSWIYLIQLSAHGIEHPPGPSRTDQPGSEPKNDRPLIGKTANGDSQTTSGGKTRQSDDQRREIWRGPGISNEPSDVISITPTEAEIELFLIVLLEQEEVTRTDPQQAQSYRARIQIQTHRPR